MHRTQGAITLLTTTLLSFIMAGAMVALSRSLIMEHRMAANHVRTTEAAALADSAMVLTQRWLQTSAWQQQAIQCPPPGQDAHACPPLLPTEIGPSTGESYREQVWITPLQDWVGVKATVTSTDRSIVSRQSAVFKRHPRRLLLINAQTPGAWPPPSCQLVPCAWSDLFAVQTSTATSWASEVGAGKGTWVPCEASFTGRARLFVLTAEEPLATLVPHTDCNGSMGLTVGSLEAPVVLLIAPEAGCPVPPAGSVWHGVIHYAAATCTAQAWSRVTVHGAVVMQGRALITQSGLSVDWPSAWQGVDINDLLNLGIDSVATVPGTWADHL